MRKVLTATARVLYTLIRAMLAHARELGLDPIRVDYLKAVEARLDETDRMMTPTREELEKFWRDEFKDLQRSFPTQPSFEQRLHSQPGNNPLFRDIDARHEKLLAHERRLTQNFNLVFMLETEMDDLVKRLSSHVRIHKRGEVDDDAPPELVRVQDDEDTARDHNKGDEENDLNDVIRHVENLGQNLPRDLQAPSSSFNNGKMDIRGGWKASPRLVDLHARSPDPPNPAENTDPDQSAELQHTPFETPRSSSGEDSNPDQVEESEHVNDGSHPRSPSERADYRHAHEHSIVLGEAQPPIPSLGRSAPPDAGPEIEHGSDSDSLSGESLPEEPPSLEKALGGLMLQPHEMGAEDITRLWRLNEPLFLDIPRSPEAIQRLAAVYRPYQQANPFRGSSNDLLHDHWMAHQMVESWARDRFRGIDQVIAHLINDAGPLGLDETRVRYLQALRLRLRFVRKLLSPTPRDIWRRGLARANALTRSRSTIRGAAIRVVERQTAQHLTTRLQIALNNWDRIGADTAYLSFLERSLDELVEGRSGALHLAGRWFRRDISSKQAASRLVDLRTRSSDPPSGGGSSSEDRGRSHNQGIGREPTIDETLDDLGLRREDPGAVSIASYHRLRQPVFMPLPRSPDALQQLAAAYQPHQRAHPFRGSQVDVLDEMILAHQLSSDYGRGRFRSVDPVLKHLIDNADSLGLDQTRVRYLEALRGRFRLVERLLTPTPAEITNRAAARARGRTLDSSLTNVIRQSIEETVQRSRIRMRVAINNVERISLDSTFLSQLEDELDQMVSGATARMATGTHLFRREVSARPVAFGGVDMHLRSPGPADAGISAGSSDGSQQGAAGNRNAALLHIPRPERGLDRAAHFLNQDQPLFPPVPRTRQTLQRLDAVFRTYQQAHPVPIAHIDILDFDVLTNELMYTGARDRFRNIQPVLSHLINNAGALGLDRTRIDYLETLRDRFRLAERLLTPTVNEIESRGVEKIRRLQLGPFLVQDLARIKEETSQFLSIRINIADNNGARLRRDLLMLSNLERQLEYIVAGASTRMATGGILRRLHRRGVSETGATQASAQDEDSRPALQRRRADATGLGDPTGSRRTTRVPPAEELPGTIDVPHNEPGGDPITGFLLRNQPVLPTTPWARDQRDYLLSSYANYQSLIPERGRNLNLLDTALHERLKLEDIGRDRFRHMRPVLAHLIEHKDAIGLDDNRVAFLEALHSRFADTDRLLSPTSNDLGKQTHRATRQYVQGRLSLAGYRAKLRQSEQLMAERTQRSIDNSHRILGDLDLVNLLERELENLSDQPRSLVTQVGRLLPRRVVNSETEHTKPDSSEDKESLLVKRVKRRVSQVSVVPESHGVAQSGPTEDDLRGILEPTGMQLEDQHGPEIAAWRWNEASLLDHAVIPADLRVALHRQWTEYAARFAPLPETGSRETASREQLITRIPRFYDTDEGRRFGSARDIIR